MFADDPSEEGFPFRQKCLSRNRENGRVEKGEKERYGEDTKYLTEAEFYQLMDEHLHDPACKFCDVVHEMVRGRAETAEAKERELAEEEALLKAMQRGELPQGDE